MRRWRWMIGTVKKLNIEQGTEEQGILNWRAQRIPLTPKGELRAQRISLTPKGELEGTKNLPNPQGGIEGTENSPNPQGGIEGTEIPQ